MLLVGEDVRFTFFTREMLSQLTQLSIISSMLGANVFITGAQDDFYQDGVGHRAHREGRAVDLRSRDLEEEQVAKLVAYIERFSMPKARVVRDPAGGTGPHLHVEWSA